MSFHDEMSATYTKCHSPTRRKPRSGNLNFDDKTPHTKPQSHSTTKKKASHKAAKNESTLTPAVSFLTGLWPDQESRGMTSSLRALSLRGILRSIMRSRRWSNLFVNSMPDTDARYRCPISMPDTNSDFDSDFEPVWIFNTQRHKILLKVPFLPSETTL
jgi:hypothetical protein